MTEVSTQRPPPMHRLLSASLFCLILLLGATRGSAAPFTALGDGEKLVYRVTWGVLTAGEITLSAQAEAGEAGEPLMRIGIATRTRGVVRGFYSYESRTEALIEKDTGRLLWVKETGADRDRPLESRTEFDHAKKVAHHRDTHRPGRNTDIPLPAGDDMLDLVSALVQTRYWTLKTGDKRDVLVFGGRDVFPVTIHAENVEKVKTPLGSFQALMLTPRMEKEPPRGIFKRGEMHVWIAQKAPFLPVRMQLQLNFGTAVLSLSEHTPPSKATEPAKPANGS